MFDVWKIEMIDDDEKNFKRTEKIGIISLDTKFVLHVLRADEEWEGDLVWI